MAPTGTLWRGQGELIAAAAPVGVLNWSFRPADLLRGVAGIDWRLVAADYDLTGTADQSTATVAVSVSGVVTSAAINSTLAPYLIGIAGDVTVDDVTVEVGSPPVAPFDFAEADGQLHWQGGVVTYDLAGERQRVTLPPLRATLELRDGRPSATVTETDSTTPLIVAQLLANGYVKVGMTRRFTVLVGNPWPGSDPDHVVVLEVEEQLL